MTPTVPPSPAQGETAGVSEERLAELVGRVAVDYVTDSGKVNRRELAAICGELLAARQQLAELESNKRALEGVYAVAVKSQTELSQQLAEMRGAVTLSEVEQQGLCDAVAMAVVAVNVATGDEHKKALRMRNTLQNLYGRLAPTSQPSRGKCPTCGGTRTNPRWDGMHFSTYDCPDCAQPERQGADK